MLDENDVRQIEQVLKRIFSFPVTKLTFKEVQRSIFTIVKEDREKANQVLETFLIGHPNQDGNGQSLKKLIEEFTIRIRLAKDVLEKGEFISFLSSDVINSQNPIFVNQLRRIDGEEFQFLTEPEGVLHLLKHFIGRIEELQRLDKSKNFLKNQSNELKSVRDRLDKLIP